VPPSPTTLPTFDDVRRAADRIGSHAHRTPVLTSRLVDERAGTRVFFKCENLQRVGAFKFRGACNAVLSLDDDGARAGVATHSSGNHAAAIALAAKRRGIPAFVVMPTSAPAPKRAAVLAYGARVIDCAPTLADREATVLRVIAETGATMIHPFDDVRVIAGQGTAALELLADVADLDAVLVPIGGGGLFSGTAIAVRGLSKTTRVIACEPATADDAFRSVRAGELLPSGDPTTIADGLRTSLSRRTFEALRTHGGEVVTVTEEQIVDAMRFVWERMKIIIEPSSAVPVAALFAHQIDAQKGARIGVILSGGNVDLDRLPWSSPRP
jgi:threonine dehydratase